MLEVGYITVKNLDKKMPKHRLYNIKCNCSFKKNWLFRNTKTGRICQGCYKEYTDEEFNKNIKECKLQQEEHNKLYTEQMKEYYKS